MCFVFALVVCFVYVVFVGSAVLVSLAFLWFTFVFVILDVSMAPFVFVASVASSVRGVFGISIAYLVYCAYGASGVFGICVVSAVSIASGAYSVYVVAIPVALFIVRLSLFLVV